ncbi:hypothetical protein C7B05_22475 [Escherichia coli]|nr:hypothetical protein C7B05_22475 [Escherichia coli]
MEHGARLSTSRVLAIAFIFMSLLIVLSLAVNVIQGVNVTNGAIVIHTQRLKSDPGGNLLS